MVFYSMFILSLFLLYYKEILVLYWKIFSSKGTSKLNLFIDLSMDMNSYIQIIRTKRYMIDRLHQGSANFYLEKARS